MKSRYTSHYSTSQKPVKLMARKKHTKATSHHLLPLFDCSEHQNEWRERGRSGPFLTSLLRYTLASRLMIRAAADYDQRTFAASGSFITHKKSEQRDGGRVECRV